MKLSLEFVILYVLMLSLEHQLKMSNKSDYIDSRIGKIPWPQIKLYLSRHWLPGDDESLSASGARDLTMESMNEPQDFKRVKV